MMTQRYAIPIPACAAALFAAALLAACGERAAPPPEELPIEMRMELDEPAADTVPPPASPPGATLDDADVLAVSLTLSEWEISTSQARIGRGPVTFLIQNRGEQEHVVEIQREEGGRWRSTTVSPGGRIQMSMMLAPGEYRIICPLGDGDHERRGMSTRLIVQ
jgi:hypothetical protein